MARVNRGGGRSGNRASLPSANELLNIFNKAGDIAIPFTGAPLSVSKATITAAKSVIFDRDQVDQYYEPTEYRNLAGQRASDVEYVDPTGKTPSDRPFYDFVEGEFYVPGETPDEMEDSSPAPLTLVPTSTTNPKRPRTVAAGYDEDEEKLTVMFRDGTLYNYYEVDKNEWAAFKANRSKGAVIYRMLDFKPRGYADESNFTRQQLQAFYRISRGTQIASGGKGIGQTRTRYKTAAQNKGKNPSKGGKAPKRK